MSGLLGSSVTDLLSNPGQITSALHLSFPIWNEDFTTYLTEIPFVMIRKKLGDPCYKNAKFHLTSSKHPPALNEAGSVTVNTWLYETDSTIQSPRQQAKYLSLTPNNLTNQKSQGSSTWKHCCYRFFCRAEKFLLKVGLIWLRSSTREWLRKLGLAGLGLKL